MGLSQPGLHSELAPDEPEEYGKTLSQKTKTDKQQKPVTGMQVCRFNLIPRWKDLGVAGENI